MCYLKRCEYDEFIFRRLAFEWIRTNNFCVLFIEVDLKKGQLVTILFCLSFIFVYFNDRIGFLLPLKNEKNKIKIDTKLDCFFTEEKKFLFLVFSIKF